MYLNYIEDRKSLGYECLIDIHCGNRLVLITDSSVIFIKNLPFNGKRKAKKFFAYVMCLFHFGQPLAYFKSAIVAPLPPSIAIHRGSNINMEQDKFLRSKKLKIAIISEPKIDKIRLTNNQIKQFNDLVLQINSGSISMEQAVLQLRGGDLNDALVIIAFIIFINCFDWYAGTGVEASFQNTLPHQDPLGWFSGKYDSKNAGNGKSVAHPPSRFERDTLHRMKQMCTASADDNGFVMTYDEAYNLIKETYTGYMQITEDCRITDWQAAKKAYHFQNGFGIDLDTYQNINKEDLVTLQNTKGGFIPYVQKGNKLPPIELIKDGQQKIYNFCHLENTEINRDARHYGNTGETPCIMFFNRETKQIALFNKNSGDLITAEKFRTKTFDKIIHSGRLGNPKN